MFPKLLTIHSFVLPSYGLLVAIGFMAGLVVSVHLAQREGLPKDQMYNLGIYLALAGMLGSKLFLIVQDRSFYWENPKELFSLSTLQSGGIYYGGLLVGIAAALWFGRTHGIPFVKMGDVFAPGIALGHAFGRVGCFAAGCCWGLPTSLPWGVTFSDPYSHEVVGVPLGVRLHPTQLYEAVAEALIFVFLFLRYPKKRFDGQILGWYLVLYPTVRFLVEFLRSHEVDGIFWGNFSDAQALSVLLIGAAAWLLWLGPYRRRGIVPVQSIASLSHEHTTAARRAAKLHGN